MADAYRKVFEIDEIVELEDTLVTQGYADFVLRGNDPTDMLIWRNDFVAASGHSEELNMNFWPLPFDDEDNYVTNAYTNVMYLYIYCNIPTMGDPFTGRAHGQIEVVFLPIDQPV